MDLIFLQLNITFRGKHNVRNVGTSLSKQMPEATLNGTFNARTSWTNKSARLGAAVHETAVAERQ